MRPCESARIATFTTLPPTWLGEPGLGNYLSRMDVVADRLTDIVFQQSASTKKPHAVLAPLDLTGLTYRSNAGHVFKVAMHAAGYEWSRDGKQLWHRSSREDVIEWAKPAIKNSRCAPYPRRFTSRQVLNMSLKTHVAPAPAAAAGSLGMQRWSCTFSRATIVAQSWTKGTWLGAACHVIASGPLCESCGSAPEGGQ